MLNSQALIDQLTGVNRIAPNTDLSALTAKRVEQICISPHQVQLRLEDDLFIAIECEFLFGEGRTGHRGDDYVVHANDFASLLGHRIQAARVMNEDRVIFVFSNGKLLSIFDSNDRYESFQIQLPEKLLIV